MPVVAILALTAIAAAPAPKPAATGAAKPVCQNAGMSFADRLPAPPTTHPLTAEPPAKLIPGVLRTVDGCSRPVVAREDVGAPRR
ncbi:MAG: hypothetical protein ABI810_17560 [Sphingomonas bacterium]